MRLAIPDSLSSELPVTVKPPETPGRTNTVVPVALAFVNEPKESVGWLGAVVSIWISCEPTGSTLPTASKERNLTVLVPETVKGAV